MNELLYHFNFFDDVVEIASHSKCVSFKVGAILVKDGEIISTGYNGTPKGCINCNDIFESHYFDREKHHQFSTNCEIHAEMNAIIKAANEGISIKDSILYTTLKPCSNCIKNICNTDIKTIFYLDEYDKAGYDEYVIDMIERSKLRIIRLGDEYYEYKGIRK